VYPSTLAVWQEAASSGTPWVRRYAARSGSSVTSTVAPSSCRYTTHCWQHPQPGSRRTSKRTPARASVLVSPSSALSVSPVTPAALSPSAVAPSPALPAQETNVGPSAAANMNPPAARKTERRRIRQRYPGIDAPRHQPQSPNKGQQKGLRPIAGLDGRPEGRR
jgi:hypothetical protein